LTCDAIIGTPRPSSPILHARQPWNSTSDEASARPPSLSLSRCTRKFSSRSMRKHDSPSGACASVKKKSHITIVQNHLWPKIA
jgi:hypothetical protein